MIISYATRPLRLCCCNLADADATYGSAIAQDLLSMIADAEASEDAQELIDLYDDAAQVDEDGQGVTFKLGTTHTVHFVPVGEYFESADNGIVNWLTVGRMKLTEIVEVQ